VDGVPPAAILRGIRRYHSDDHADFVNNTDNVVNDNGNAVNHTDREHHDSHPDPGDLEVERLTGSPFFPKPPTARPVGV
jgi:hypothetical protein